MLYTHDAIQLRGCLWCNATIRRALGCTWWFWLWLTLYFFLNVSVMVCTDMWHNYGAEHVIQGFSLMTSCINGLHNIMWGNWTLLFSSSNASDTVKVPLEWFNVTANGSWVLCVVQSYNWLAHEWCVWSRVTTDWLMCVVCGPELQFIDFWMNLAHVCCVWSRVTIHRFLDEFGSWVLCVVQSYKW